MKSIIIAIGAGLAGMSLMFFSLDATTDRAIQRINIQNTNTYRVWTNYTGSTLTFGDWNTLRNANLLKLQ